jgi:DNA mismatch repair protein MutL
MEDIIRLLPDSIANQIAAGEVVQRPASVVKELLENSIDAGATEIKLVIREAGKSLVQVIDNGIGMSPTDARMSLERHATSKIRTAEDLFRIKSMGFRGEALASIAAVAHVELKTRRESDELGLNLEVQASEVKNQAAVAMNNGTSIAVKTLFFNIPDSRNFLKSNPVEQRHIHDEFQRVAIANPEVRFMFINHDEEVYNLEPGKLGKRIVKLFHKNHQHQLIPCQEETPSISIRGYVGKPEFAKKTRGEQFFYVNKRFIKNGYLHHAVVNAYQGMIKEDHHPFYVIFIEMDPAHVDINVHPTKTEVKFDDDRMLYGVIASAVKQALASFNVAPSLDFSTDVNFEHFSRVGQEQRTSKADRNYTSFRDLDSSREKIKNWEMLYQQADEEIYREMQKAKKELPASAPEKPAEKTFQSDLGNVAVSKEFETAARSAALSIHGKYLIKQVKSGMVVIDRKAAYERILFEQYLNRIRSQQSISQSCLFPQQLNLNSSDMSLVREIAAEIKQLGFDFDELGDHTIVIRGVPGELSNGSETEIFEGLIEQFKYNQKQLDLDNKENLARSLAKRTAGRLNSQLQPEEINGIFDQLFACQQPNYAPDGQPTFVVLGLEKIAALFK